MATCLETPTLTLYSTSTSTTVFTTSTVTLQTQPDGSVSTATIPLIITSIVTIVNPTSTLYASCSSTPISTIPSSLSQSTTLQPVQSPSFAPTTVLITSTPPPTVITTAQPSTLANGAITVLTITTTSTPSPEVIVISTSVLATPSSTSNSSSSNIIPIVAGAVGGFFFLIGAVAAIWFISKKCRKPRAATREEDRDEIVFPYPVARDRQPVDLSRPYEYGHVGRPMPTTGPESSPGVGNNTYANDGRRDSATALIGTGLTPMVSNSGTLASIPGPQNQLGGGGVGRQPSRNSAYALPPGAAPPGGAPPMDHYSPSVTGRSSSLSGSSTTSPGPPNRRPLQVMNSSLSPISVQSGFSLGDGPNSGSGPTGVPESAWPEKQEVSSSGGPFIVHADGGHIQGSGHRPSVSGGSASVLVPGRRPSTQLEPTVLSEEPNEPPPAYYVS